LLFLCPNRDRSCQYFGRKCPTLLRKAPGESQSDVESSAAIPAPENQGLFPRPILIPTKVFAGPKHTPRCVSTGQGVRDWERKKSEAWRSHRWQSLHIAVRWHQAGETLEAMRRFSPRRTVVVAPSRANQIFANRN